MLSLYRAFSSSLTPLPLKTAIRLKPRTLITPGLSCPNFQVPSNFRKRHGVFFWIVLASRQTGAGVEAGVIRANQPGRFEI
jgi:hypothetical protein